MRALVAIALIATPAAAETRLGGGYMMTRPIAGDAGGADHAIVLRWEQAVRAGLDLGLAVQGGHAPGNDEETLTRLAVMPTLGVRGELGELIVRGDIGVGWQLAHGRAKFAGIPARGTEARGLRAELGLSATAALTTRVALRARIGVVLDGTFPVSLPSSTRLGPLVEAALVLGL